MDFITAVRYAKLGYRIRRPAWAEEQYIDEDSELDAYRWMDNVLADDWEIITEGIVEHFPVITYSNVEDTE